MTPLLGSVVEAIGATPLVELGRLRARLGLDGRILAKLDYLQPGFSKKDRAARRIVEDARASGELAPGQTVVELTSGNMGTGLAIVCAVHGHPFVAVMSEGNSVERRRMMQALGAEVVLVPQAPGGRAGEVSGADLALVEEAAQRLTRERGAFRADQFARSGNPDAHMDGTGPEIREQSGGTVTAFCDFVGSGGTLAGCARFLARRGVRCWAVEPDGRRRAVRRRYVAPGPSHPGRRLSHAGPRAPARRPDRRRADGHGRRGGHLGALARAARGRSSAAIPLERTWPPP